MNLDEYIDELVRLGMHQFNSGDLQHQFDLSIHTVRRLILKMRHAGKIISPVPNFHVIVPLERRHLKHVDVIEYIDGLMSHLNCPYYIGLMSAAAFHGASHQAVQMCQVVVPKQIRNIQYGENKRMSPISFTVKKNMMDMDEKHIFQRPGRYSIFKVSSPEATLFDLARHPKESGGWSNIATIAIDLTEKLNPFDLQKYANGQAIGLVQRLGYVFDLAGKDQLADALYFLVDLKKPSWTSLVRKNMVAGKIRNRKWKLVVNAEIEHDYI